MKKVFLIGASVFVLMFSFTGLSVLAAKPTPAYNQSTVTGGGLARPAAQAAPAPVIVTTPSAASASAAPASGRSSISSSCSGITSTGLGGIVNCFIGFLNDATMIIIALTVVVILIGGFNMISSEEKREEGKKTLMYGVIGLAVMVSIWGLVNIVISTFGIGSAGPISPPALVK